jgi:hypothetical protein
MTTTTTGDLLAAVRSEHRLTPLHALLHQTPDVLLGIDAAAKAALEQLDIHTVFDLATSSTFDAATKLSSVSGNADSPLYRHGAATSDLVRESALAGVGVDAIGHEPIAVIQSVPEASADVIAQALDVATVQELASWPPYLAARRIFTHLFFPENTAGFDPERPVDLLPVTGQYPTERVQYASLLMDEIRTLEGDKAINITDPDFRPLDLAALAAADTGFSRVAFGALLTFTQSWFAQGVTLGQLLHSTALAPGESTRVAVIDWTRRSRAGETESITEVDDLTQDASHNRSINEVTDAVATEAQEGFSESNTNSSSTQFGMSAAAELSAPLGGLLGGPSGSMGTSLSTASTSSHADSYASSFGRRQISTSMNQKVNDRTHQHAHSSRNRRASVVKEVAQSEHESVSTRVIANYNHMHALTVQYYEVVQLYRIETAVTRAEKVVFVPVALPDFTDQALVRRFQSVLARAALTSEMREALRTLDVIELAPVPATRFSAFDGPIKDILTDTLVTKFGTRTALAKAPRVAAALDREAVSAAVAEKDTGATEGTGETAVTGRALAARMSTAVETLESAVVEPVRGLSAAALARENILADTRIRVTEAMPLITQISSHLWLADQIDRLSGLLGSPLLRRGSASVYLPTDVTVEGASVTAQAGSFTVIFRLASGADVTELSPSDPVRLSEVRRILLRGTSAAEQNVAVTLTVNRNGVRFPLRLPEVVVKKGTNTTQPVVDVQPGGVGQNVIAHLAQNKLHYAQAIYRSLDAVQIAMLLAGHTITVTGEVVPLAQAVDPKPIRYIGNYLAFTMNVEPTDPEWAAWLKDHGVHLGKPNEDVVPLGTGGTFAEAVLGRSNSAEKLDLTRFWNWQDSPTPLVPTEIAAVQTGSRATAEDVKPGQLSQPIVNLMTPTTLPDPAGTAAVLSAIQNGSMFRDMSGLQATVGLAQAALQASSAGAATAGQQAGTNMNSLLTANTERQRIAASMISDLAKTAASMYTGVPMAGGGSSPSGGTHSTDGAKVNYFDSTKTQGGSKGSGAAQGNGSGGADGGGSNGSSAGGDATGGGSTTGAGADGTAYSQNPAALAATWGDSQPASGLLTKVMDHLGAGLGEESPTSGAPTTARSAWPKLDPAQVMAGKERIALNANDFNQGAIGLCTGAAFFHHFVQRKPDTFRQFVNSLFGFGTGYLGQLKVNPGSDLRQVDYAALAAKFPGFPPPTEWMSMCALRDSENWFFDFDGSPDDSDMETSTKELAGWYEDTEIWSSVKLELDTTPAAIKGVKKTPTNQVAMWIKLPLIGDNRQGTHMICIESPIVINEAQDKVTFDYWTWAQPVKTCTTTWTNLKANFLGAITATQ